MFSISVHPLAEPIDHAVVDVLALGTGDDMPEDGDEVTKRWVYCQLLDLYWKTRYRCLLGGSYV